MVLHFRTDYGIAMDSQQRETQDGHWRYHSRSFYDVDDLFDRMIKLTGSLRKISGPVNTSNLGKFMVKQLVEKVLVLVGSHSKLTHVDLPQDRLIKTQPDISSANSALIWESKISLDDRLVKIMSFFKGIL